MANEGKKTTANKGSAKTGNRVAATVGKGSRKGTKSTTTKAVARSTKRLPQSPNVETLIAKAIGKGNLDVVERLMAMRRELKAEAAREAFWQDLAAAQREFPVIRKSIGVFNKAEKGGDLRYRYAPMEEIEQAVGPIIAKYGFSYLFKPKVGSKSVKVIMEIHHTAGHVELTEFTVPIQADAYMTAPQKVASALTFAKRYVFIDGFGIVTGDVDDDGLSAGIVNGSRTTRDVSPERKQPKPVLDKVPEDAIEQFKKQLGKMHWLPDKTKGRYLDQAHAFIEKGDVKSLRGLAQSLSRQMALKAKEASK